MKLVAIDIFFMFFITTNAIKASIVMAAAASGQPAAFKRQLTFRSVMVATIVLLIFALFGDAILHAFHISSPALLIAGGIILLLFALDLVLGHGLPGGGEPGKAPSLDLAIYPLAMPLMATPQGIVAVVTIAAGAVTAGDTLTVVGCVLGVMLINVGLLLAADKITARLGPTVLLGVMKVLGVLLAALAVQIVLFGAAKLQWVAPELIR